MAGLLSELIQGAARGRAAYLGGRRQGRHEAEASELARRKMDSEERENAAQAEYYRRQASLRDPNDPELIRLREGLRRGADESVARIHEKGSLVGDLRRVLQTTNEQLRPLRSRRSQVVKELNKPRPLVFPSPKDSTDYENHRHEMEADTAQTGEQIRSLEGQFRRDKSLLRSIVPGVQVDDEDETPQRPTMGADEAQERAEVKRLYQSAISRAGSNRSAIAEAHRAAAEAALEIDRKYGSKHD